MTESFWNALEKVLDYTLLDEERDYEARAEAGEDEETHIVHDLRTLKAALDAHRKG
jgi:hypothetical protein